MEKDMKNDELLNNEEQNENIDNNVNEEAAEKEAAENVNADKEAEEPIPQHRPKDGQGGGKGHRIQDFDHLFAPEHEDAGI